MHASHTAEIVAGLVGLLLIAIAIQALSDRLRFPFSVALLIGGILLGELGHLVPLLAPISELRISADLILYVFLPALVFESAFHLDLRDLRRNLVPVLTLAVPGLLLSTFIIGGILSVGTAIPLAAALLLGAILSATDPVAVIALFKRLGAPQRLTVLVEGESLFNDATSIVLSRILVGIAMAGTITLAEVGSGLVDFFIVFVGGILVGWACAELTHFVLGRVRAQAEVEITLTTILAYVSFLLAEEALHVSGVMATVTAGLVFGNRGWMRVSRSVRSYLEHFWEYMAFVATALIFLMVGLAVDLRLFSDLGGTLAWLIGGMLFSRALIVFGLTPLVDRLPGAQAISPAYKAVMYWGGLRGAIALAIVLSLPDAFAYKEQFTALVIGGVLFTLLVQGVTMDPLVRKLGLGTPPLPDRMAKAESILEAKSLALKRLPELSAGGVFSTAIANRLTAAYSAEKTACRDRLDDIRGKEVHGDAERALAASRALTAERELLHDLFDKGHLDERVFRLLLNANAVHLDAARHRGALPDRQLSKLSTQGRMSGIIDAMSAVIPGLSQKRAIAQVAAEYQAAWAQFQTSTGVLDRLDLVAPDTLVDARLRHELRQHYEQARGQAHRQLDDTAEQFPEFVAAMQARHAARMGLLAESEVYSSRADHGTLSASAAEGLLHATEVALDRLRGLEADKLRTEPKELLKKVPFFAEVTDAEFSKLADRLQEKTTPAGANIIQAGESGDSLFLIARGVLRVVINTPDGEREVATLMAGDFFGEMALLHRAPRAATVRAVTPCTVYELSRSDFEPVDRAHPQIRKALMDADQTRRAQLDG